MDKFTKVRMNKLIAVTLLSFIVFTFRVDAMRINTENLFSAKLKDRMAAYEKIVSVKNRTEKQQIILNLIEILRRRDVNRTFEGPLHLTIKALGELKATEAIPDMLPYFTFVPEAYRVEESIPTQWYYPTARAFVKIGEPVIKYMESIIAAEDQSDEAKRLAAWVIKEVMGKKIAIEKIQRFEQQHVSSRLGSGEKLSEYIRDFKLTFNHPHKHKKLPKDK